MQSITVKQLHENTVEILGQLAGNGEIIVTEGGKPLAILTGVPDNDVEKSIVELKRARAEAAVNSMQNAAKNAGMDRLSLDEIDKEIRAARESQSNACE